MKFKITRKELKENYLCISVGYGDLQYLLSQRIPIAYNCGVYGWNYDVYTFEDLGYNIALCTGYRSMPGKNPHVADISCREWNQKAKNLFDSFDYLQMQERNEAMKNLLIEFLNLCQEKLFNT